MAYRRDTSKYKEHGDDKVEYDGDKSGKLDFQSEIGMCIIIVIVLLAVIFLVVLICACVMYYKKRKKRRNSRTEIVPPPPPYAANSHPLTNFPGYPVSVAGHHLPNQQRACYPPCCYHNQAFNWHTDQARERFNNGRCDDNQYPLLRHPAVGNCTSTNNMSRHDSNDLADDPPDLGLFENFDTPLRELYQISDRSISKEVGGKLVVSVTHRVNCSGDVLILDNMGISLHVPKDAVRRGKEELISLVLNWDLSDNPHMSKEQSLVSPVVFVGPHGLKLDKPCTLSYRHCAFDPRHIRVMRSETDLIDEKQWQPLCDSEEEKDSYTLTQDECRLNINSFTLFTCIQVPLNDIWGKKWLQIAVFACPLRRSTDHYQIRMYFLNKTPCALQWAIQNEAKFNSRQVCPEKVFLFDGGDSNMFVNTKYVSENWELVDQTNLDKVQFETIWHGQCPHVSICYKRVSNVQRKELNLELQMYQDGYDNVGEKIIVQALEDNSTPLSVHETRCMRSHIGDVIVNINSSATDSHAALTGSDRPDGSRTNLHVNINQPSCSGNVRDIIELSDSGFKRIVPHEVRKQLVMFLDPRNTLGNDWRELASQLNLDGCIPLLATKHSPTEAILNVVDARNISLECLQEMLINIERCDAAAVIEDYLEKTRPKRLAVENEFHSNSNIYVASQHSQRRNFH